MHLYLDLTLLMIQAHFKYIKTYSKDVETIVFEFIKIKLLFYENMKWHLQLINFLISLTYESNIINLISE